MSEPVEINVRDNGPYKVTGPVRVIDPDGSEFRLPAGEAVALCRCGQSQTKPLCDGSHRTEGFVSCERASQQGGADGAVFAPAQADK
jgi:CDGSH-type Zn-finger protein